MSNMPCYHLFMRHCCFVSLICSSHLCLCQHIMMKSFLLLLKVSSLISGELLSKSYMFILWSFRKFTRSLQISFMLFIKDRVFRAHLAVLVRAISDIHRMAKACLSDLLAFDFKHSILSASVIEALKPFITVFVSAAVDVSDMDDAISNRIIVAAFQSANSRGIRAIAKRIAIHNQVTSLSSFCFDVCSDSRVLAAKRLNANALIAFFNIVISDRISFSFALHFDVRDKLDLVTCFAQSIDNFRSASIAIFVRHVSDVFSVKEHAVKHHVADFKLI